MIVSFSRTSLEGVREVVYINPEAVTSIMPAGPLRPGGSGVTVHGFTYPILVDEAPAEVAQVIRSNTGGTR